MGRKKAKDPSEEIEDEETLKEKFSKQVFEPPTRTELETIFEQEDAAVKRSTRVQSSFNVGKNRELRVIEPYQYWKLDVDKHKKRKHKISKQFKGRKKPKFTPLTPDKEIRLLETIENLDDTLDDSSLPTDISNHPTPVPEEPSPDCATETPVVVQNEENTNSRRRKAKRRQTSLFETDPLNQTPRADKENSPSVSTPSLNSASSNSSMPFTPLGTPSFLDNHTQLGGDSSVIPEEFRKLIGGADELCGIVGQTPLKEPSQSQKVKVQVRRSSRFFRGATEVGSVLQVMEVDEKKLRRQSRRSGFFHRPPPLSRSPSPLLESPALREITNQD